MPTVKYPVEGMVRNAPIPSARFSARADADAFGAKFGLALGQVANMVSENAKNIQDEQDQAAVNEALTKAYERSRLENKVYEQDGTSLFSGGKSTDDAYKETSTLLSGIGRDSQDNLRTPRQRQLFKQEWDKHQDTELKSSIRHIGTQFRSFQSDQRKTHLVELDNQLSLMYSQVESDWTLYKEAANNAVSMIDTARQLGVDNLSLRQRAVNVRNGIGSAVVRGWAKQQPDEYHMLESLYAGKINNSKVQSIWDSLPAEEQQKAFSKLSQESSKLATLRNSQRKEREDLYQSQAESLVKDFFFNERVGHDQRQNLFDLLKHNEYVPVSTIEKMEQFLMDGGKDQGQDNEQSLLDIEMQILTGDIKSPVELINRVGSGISISTMRTRLLPALEKYQKAALQQVLRWGAAEFGIVEGTIIGNPQRDAANKASQFQAEMLRYFSKNPDADMWSQAEKITTRLKGQQNKTAMTALPVVTAAYRKALESGKPDDIARSKAALTAVMTDAGLVDAVQASRADFDPLNIIEAQ